MSFLDLDMSESGGLERSTKLCFGESAAWTGCIGGALTEAEFRRALEAAGFAHIEIQETHRVHEHAGLRARTIVAPACSWTR